MDERIPKRRRIERYNGPPLTSLPNEILVNITRCLAIPGPSKFLRDHGFVGGSEYFDATEVFEHTGLRDGEEPVSNRDLRSLSRLLLTCKTMHQVVLPILYEDVELWRAREFKAFFSTIMRMPWLRDRVRRLTVGQRIENGDADSYLFEVIKLARLEDLGLANLETLLISMRTPAVPALIDFAVSLPRLQKLAVCETGHSPGSHHPTFARLPTVTELHYWSISWDNSGGSLGVEGSHEYLSRFPNLETLVLTEGVDWDLIAVVPESLETLVILESENAVGFAGFVPWLKHLKIDPTILEGLLDEFQYQEDDMPQPWDSLLSAQVLDYMPRKNHVCNSLCADLEPLECRPHEAGLLDCWLATHTLMRLAETFPSLKVVQLPDFLDQHGYCNKQELMEVISGERPLFDGAYEDRLDPFTFVDQTQKCCKSYQIVRMAKLVEELRLRLEGHGVELRAPNYTDKSPPRPCSCKMPRRDVSPQWPLYSDEDESVDGSSEDNSISADPEGELDSDEFPEFPEGFDSDGASVGLDSGGVEGNLDSGDSGEEDAFDGEERRNGHVDVVPRPNHDEGSDRDSPQRAQVGRDHLDEDDTSDYDEGGWQENEIEFADD